MGIAKDNAEAQAIKDLRTMVKLEWEVEEIDVRILELKKKHITPLEEQRDGVKAKAFEFRLAAEALMAKFGITQLLDKYFSAHLRDIKPKLEVVDDTKIPDAFIELKRVVKKTELNKFYKETGTVPAGCTISGGAWVLVVEKKKE